MRHISTKCNKSGHGIGYTTDTGWSLMQYKNDWSGFLFCKFAVGWIINLMFISSRIQVYIYIYYRYKKKTCLAGSKKKRKFAVKGRNIANALLVVLSPLLRVGWAIRKANLRLFTIIKKKKNSMPQLALSNTFFNTTFYTFL